MTNWEIEDKVPVSCIDISDKAKCLSMMFPKQTEEQQILEDENEFFTNQLYSEIKRIVK